MSDHFQREREVALGAVREAAKICSRVQKQIAADVLEKRDRSPVTVADFASQAAVCRIIGDAFPGEPIIAEEDSHFLREPDNAAFLASVRRELSAAGAVDEPTNEDVLAWIDRGGAQHAADRFWTLDPIDGTKGFLRGEQYAISLALVINGEIQLGVLGCPNLPMQALRGGGESEGSLYSAIRGGGTHVCSLADPDTAPRPVHVSSTSDPSRALMCESVESGHSSHTQSQQIADRLGMRSEPVRLDSQAKYAVVARGEADTYLRLPTHRDYREKIWDHAGGVLIVEEAGGSVTDVYGRPLEFTHGRDLAANAGVIVTNGKLHAAVLAAVQAVLAGSSAGV